MKNPVPAHLSAESKAIFKVVKLEWELNPSHLLLLRTALEAFDRMQEARRKLKKEGATYRSKEGDIKKHPALQIEKEARIGFLRAWKMLNLDVAVNASDNVEVSWSGTGQGSITKVYRSPNADFTGWLHSVDASVNPYEYVDSSGTDSHIYFYRVQ